MSGSLSLQGSLFTLINLHGRRLKVFKKFLTGKQMSEAAFVQEAAHWSRELTRMRARGPGDAENALRGIEKEYGINYWTLWQLRYRLAAVKKISAGAYASIKSAYDAERQRQFASLKQELEITEAASGADNVIVSAVRALVGEGE